MFSSSMPERGASEMLLGSVESLSGCNELVNLIRISALNTAFCFHWGRVSVVKLLVSTCHREGGYNLMVCSLECLVIIFLGGGMYFIIKVKYYSQKLSILTPLLKLKLNLGSISDAI